VTKGRDFFVQVDCETGEAEFIRELPADAGCLVCMELSVPLILPDNAIGTCVVCGIGIQFRPVGARPDIVKVCLACAPSFIEGANNPQ
jgi:hypothetical protein